MTSGLPKIWATDFETKPVNMTKLDPRYSGQPMDYINLYDARVPVTREQAPDYLFFDKTGYPEKLKSSLHDLFKVGGGIIVISERFHDLLQGFDLGPTQLIEVPVFEYDQQRQRPGRFWILHIVAQKTEFVPEASENVEIARNGKAWWPDPAMRGDDVIAVRASAAEGPDLWVDPTLIDRIFVSDRLYRAIKTEKITARSLKFKPCRVV